MTPSFALNVLARAARTMIAVALVTAISILGTIGTAIAVRSYWTEALYVLASIGILAIVTVPSRPR